MHNIHESKLSKMFNVAKSIEQLDRQGVDTRHLIPDTIHINQDGSGLQLKLLGGDGGMRDFSKGKSYGGGIGSDLTPYLIHLSPLFVRSILKVINGTVRTKKEITEELEDLGERALGHSLDRFISNKITGALEPTRVKPIVRPATPVMGPPTESSVRGFRTI
tara:strand:+ start:4579 stop:5064 length:486 start_codon:yes stop_codon:yes gene_type:complete